MVVFDAAATLPEAEVATRFGDDTFSAVAFACPVAFTFASEATVGVALAAAFGTDFAAGAAKTFVGDLETDFGLVFVIVFGGVFAA